VNPMLALRNAWCNERWEEKWLVIERELRREVAVRRQERRAGRPGKATAQPAAPAAPGVTTKRASPAPTSRTSEQATAPLEASLEHPPTA
jgi:hypothetical protein